MESHKPDSSADILSAAIVERSESATLDCDGLRFDQAAALLFSDFSRARLQSWIKDGQLQLDGRHVSQRARVEAGQTLDLKATVEAAIDWSAEDLPLDIIYEDEELLVINKPAGVVVHPGAGNSSGTLVNALLNHRASLESVPRGGIVHRLDKDTSGLLVVAATLSAHAHLVDQLQERSVKREYFALVRGTPTGGGTVDAPLGRHPRQRTRMAVQSHGGKHAVTHFRIAERFKSFTALNVSLETGRTHQIRVHMAHRGYPLVGDPVYGGRLQIPAGLGVEASDTLRAFRRQALHARRLSFAHPKSLEILEFESPLAVDIAALTSSLRADDQTLDR